MRSSEAAPAAIAVQSLSYRYAGAEGPALDRVTFEAPAGRCLGLLGPNGAGKSTLMRLLCGYLPLQGDEARARVAGHDVRSESIEVRSSVGYLPEQVPLYAELRVEEHLSFRAAIKGVRRRDRRAEVQRVAERTGISARLRTPVAHLSRGYRQRVGIADALLGSPDVVMLDEPTVGLDPNQVVEMRAMLRTLRGAQTLVFSSHILAEVELLCDQIVILSQGRVVVDEPTRTVTAARSVRVHWAAGRAEVQPILDALVESGQVRAPRAPAEAEADDAGGDPASTAATLELVAEDGLSVEDVMRRVGELSARRGVVLIGLAPGRTRLEERFAEVTGVASRGGH